MELSENNLYASGKLIQLPDGQTILERELTAATESGGDIYALCKEGDLPDALADKAYKGIAGPDAAKFWWVIANNIPGLENPLDLSGFVGSQLRIPDLVRSRLENP